MRYIVEFQGFTPSTADVRGYHDADFLSSEIPADGFASEAEALAWVAANDRGADDFGVTANWRVEEMG